MNIEELKGVITVVADLGDGATAAAYAAIGAMLMNSMFGWLVGLVFIFASYKLIKLGINAAKYNGDAYLKLQRLRDSVKVGCSGTLTDAEIEIMAKLIREGQACKGEHAK